MALVLPTPSRAQRKNRIIHPGRSPLYAGGAVVPTALTLPLSIDFDDETEGQTPSFVTGETGRVAPIIEVVAAVEGHTKVLKFQAGSGATLGAGTVNLALGSGQTDGLPLDVAAGFRIQILEFRQNSTDRQIIRLLDTADTEGGPMTNHIQMEDREENNPDTGRIRTEVATVEKDTGQLEHTGNQTTGANWRYMRWQLTDQTNLIVNLYNTAGAQQGITHTTAWPADGAIPSEVLTHLYGGAGAAFYWRWATIWVGKLADAWPAM